MTLSEVESNDGSGKDSGGDIEDANDMKWPLAKGKRGKLHRQAKGSPSKSPGALDLYAKCSTGESDSEQTEKSLLA